MGLPFLLLSDPGAKTAEAWGVAMEGGDDPLAVPALFVVDSQGGIRFRHVGERMDDRAYMGDILSALSAASGP